MSAASASVAQGGTDLITATVRDLHSAALAGATVAWSVTTTPATGVADATQPLTPTSGTTGTTGTTSTTFKAGATSGTAVLAAANAGLSAATSVTVACNCWITKSPMPTPRGQLGVAVINGILYAVGGYNGGPLSTVEAYDPTTDTWTTKASMPTARSGFAVGVINGILYAAAGTQGGSLKDVVEAYDPTTDTWTTKTRAPTARFGVGGGVVNGILYVVADVGEQVERSALHDRDAEVESNRPVEAFDHALRNILDRKPARDHEAIGLGAREFHRTFLPRPGRAHAERTAAGRELLRDRVERRRQLPERDFPGLDRSEVPVLEGSRGGERFPPQSRRNFAAPSFLVQLDGIPAAFRLFDAHRQSSCPAHGAPYKLRLLTGR